VWREREEEARAVRQGVKGAQTVYDKRHKINMALEGWEGKE
jgi:hypothetical protein